MLSNVGPTFEKFCSDDDLVLRSSVPGGRNRYNVGLHQVFQDRRCDMQHGSRLIKCHMHLIEETRPQCWHGLNDTD
jgi:hypothetical protein